MDKVVFVQCECKDCKKASDRTQGAQEIFLCNQFRRLVSGNFFCKHAEKREKEGEQYV